MKTFKQIIIETELKEAKTTKSDSGKYTLIDGVIQITKKELAKIHKDYKSDKTILTMINGVTTAVPYTIINEAKSKEDLIKYYEKNLKNVEKQYSTDSRKQEYIDYAKGQLDAVKKDGTNGLIKFLKDWNINEDDNLDEAKNNYKSIKMNEAYSRSIGFKQTEEAIKLLVRQLNVNSNLAKGIFKASGNNYEKDFINMYKNITRINDIWDDMSVDILKEAKKG